MILLIRYQKPFTNLFLFVFPLLLCVPSGSLAAAWLVEPGRTQVIISQYNTIFTEYFTVDGKRRQQVAFRKQELKPYIEHGVNHKWSVGLSPSMQHVSTINAAGDKDENFALAYTEAFFKYELYHGDYDVLTFQHQFEIPGIYDEQDTPTFGKKELFISEKILYGNTFYDDGEFKSFFNFEGGIKARFKELAGNNSGTMLEVDITLGLSFDEYEVFIQPSMKKALATYRSRLNILDKYGYDIYKLELSAIKHLDEYDIQAGIYKDLYGKNTGSGQGFKLSVIKKF